MMVQLAHRLKDIQRFKICFVYVLIRHVVRADYIISNVYVGSSQCDGPAFVSQATSIGCQIVYDSFGEGTVFSFEPQCTNYGANVAYYNNSDNCSGSASVISYDAVFGCAADTENGTSTSNLNKCVSGDYYPQPNGAASMATWLNNINNTCPPIGSPFSVNTFELNSCFPASDTQAYSWECDVPNTSLNQILHMTPTCDGQSFVIQKFPLGCDSGSPTTQTTCADVSNYVRRHEPHESLSSQGTVVEAFVNPFVAAEKAQKYAFEAIMHSLKETMEKRAETLRVLSELGRELLQ